MKRVLLLVDDEADLGRLFVRLLSRSFDEVCYVGGGAAAEARLARGDVTHLVVDSALDGDSAQGQDLLAAWRRAHPRIAYAAIFTGRKLDRGALPAEVDDLFSKPEGLEALMERLGSA